MRKAIRKHFKQRETYYKLVASFLTMLVLPLLLVMMNYLYARSLLREENLNYQNAVLQQVKLTVDERLQELQLHVLDLTNDATLNQALSQKHSDTAKFNFQLWQVSDHLGNYAASASKQYETMVYSLNYDCLISANYIDYRASQGLIRMESEEMNQLLLEKLLNTRVYCQYELIETSTGSKQLLLLHTMPLWSTGRKPYATICLAVNDTELFAGITEMQELGAGVICLISPDGRIAGHLGDSQLLEAVSTADRSQQSFRMVDDISYTISRRDSKLNGWHYISIQPEHSVVNKLKDARNVSLLMLVLVLTVGFFIGWCLAQQNYEPVKRLMENLQRQSALMKSTPEKTYGEFNLIERSIKEMAHSMSALESVMKEEKSRLQEGVMMQLFRNAVTDYPRFRSTLQYAGIQLPYKKYRVTLIKWLQEANMEQKVLSRMMFRERVYQLISGTLQCVFSNVDDDNLVLLLNGEGTEFESQTSELLNEVAKDMRETYDQMFWISVSEVEDGMESVPKAYYSVVQAQPQAPEGGVRYLNEVNENCVIDKAIDNMVAQLQNFIGTGNDEGAIDCIHKNLEMDIRQRRAPMYEAKAYCISVLNIITGAYRIENSEVFSVNGQSPLKLLFMCESVSEMEALLSEVVHIICNYVREKQHSPTTQLTGQILNYIKKNYRDEELTLSSVAEHFCLTSSYLSVFFKNNVGETFLNYLTHLRMEKAKELMRTTNDAIVDISVKVGYSSANTFTRAFKKLEHITPSQYRDSNREEDI
ncbi:two-component system response regulator YesN [Lachnospiraceae bacterium PM6-15]|uniref:helix-turn-helix transcriptional regulator n=1 Tax=Ohessyouella blattaphilus TaxID=2949333 RepID=UPI003E29E0CE